jgi:hypothetical protein
MPSPANEAWVRAQNYSDKPQETISPTFSQWEMDFKSTAWVIRVRHKTENYR